MSAFLTRDMRPCTIACACLPKKNPLPSSKASDADVIALELEVDQSVQQNVVQVAADASHFQSTTVGATDNAKGCTRS